MKAYQSCHEPFIRYCSALTYGKMDTEDLVQDVLLSAWHHFSQIEKKGQLLHYLIRSARNRSISIWRKRKFQAEMLEKHTEKLQARGISADVRMDIDILFRTLDQLPERQRHALILFEISGFSMKEIAELQSSTEGAVKTKISRGRKKLKNLMADQKRPVAISSLFQTAQIILL